MRKTFNLTDENTQLLYEVKKKHGFHTETEAANYLFESYQKMIESENGQDEFIEKFLDRFNMRYYKFMERLRWATQTAEVNSIVLLDAINTILMNENIQDCVLVDKMKSNVISISQDYQKKKVEHFKQAKEDRKTKKG